LKTWKVTSQFRGKTYVHDAFDLKELKGEYVVLKEKWLNNFIKSIESKSYQIEKINLLSVIDPNGEEIAIKGKFIMYIIFNCLFANHYLPIRLLMGKLQTGEIIVFAVGPEPFAKAIEEDERILFHPLFSLIEEYKNIEEVVVVAFPETTEPNFQQP